MGWWGRIIPDGAMDVMVATDKDDVIEWWRRVS